MDARDIKSVSMTPKSGPKTTGLVLSGGGARGAYQAGVVKGIAEISKGLGIAQPVPIISGVSAGAINATYLAALCDDFDNAANQMADLWCRLTTDQVFRTDAVAAGRSGLKLFTDAAVGAFYHKKLARSLLDTTPLKKLLNETIPFDRIQKNVENGSLHSLAITAMNYTNATSETFVQARPDAPMWVRSRRTSQFADIRAEHVMGSSALPLFFPPSAIGSHQYGDGCLRNTAPLSPAIHLGADRLLVVSVRRPDNRAAPINPEIEPSMARVLGVVLNALLLDAADVDMERLSRINATIDHVPEENREGLKLRKIDYLWIRPSQDIGHLAGELFDRLPRVIRYLVRGLGSSKEASELTSYLLFDPDFCGQLVQLGYDDAMASRLAIESFLSY